MRFSIFRLSIIHCGLPSLVLLLPTSCRYQGLFGADIDTSTIVFASLRLRTRIKTHPKRSLFVSHEGSDRLLKSTIKLFYHSIQYLPRINHIHSARSKKNILLYILLKSCSTYMNLMSSSPERFFQSYKSSRLIPERGEYNKVMFITAIMWLMDVNRTSGEAKSPSKKQFRPPPPPPLSNSE